MLGVLTVEQVERVLHGQAVGRIGCHADGKTYVVPVSYAYDGERVICHSAEGEKIRMMRKNPEVCFEVDQIDNLSNWQSVIAWGRFEELKGSDAAAGMGLLVDRLMPLVLRPGEAGRSVTPHGQHANALIYAIRLREKAGRYERR
jgi:nitroimidazol reductase NimA-like FMN-containing flavoprotein (pyridoxamine 5'-phosphate oxidase superfamily)